MPHTNTGFHFGLQELHQSDVLDNLCSIGVIPYHRALVTTCPYVAMLITAEADLLNPSKINTSQDVSWAVQLLSSSLIVASKKKKENKGDFESR